MDSAEDSYAEGGCGCGAVRYRLMQAPMIVHCCHCTWCQRETGTAFAINALIESSSVELLSGKLLIVDTPSNSGRGQSFARCPQCSVALWSYYSGAGRAVAFVRAGTLDDPSIAPPDIHIFTSSKHDWIEIPEGSAAVEEYYQRSAYWPAESVARYKQAIAG